MRFGVVGNLVAHALRQAELAAVSQFRFKLAFEHQHDMTLAAPVVGEVTGRILDHAYAQFAEFACAPGRFPGSARIVDRFDFRPISDAEWNAGNMHEGLAGRGTVSFYREESRVLQLQSAHDKRLARISPAA